MLVIHNIQLTDHLKLKNREDQSVDSLVLLRRRTMAPNQPTD